MVAAVVQGDSFFAFLEHDKKRREWNGTTEATSNCPLPASAASFAPLGHCAIFFFFVVGVYGDSWYIECYKLHSALHFLKFISQCHTHIILLSIISAFIKCSVVLNVPFTSNLQHIVTDNVRSGCIR